MNPDTFSKLKSIVGPKGFTEDPAEIAPHLEEWRSKYKGRASLLLKPATTAEVAAVLELCNQTSTAVVPQGGNTGLVGAQIPFDGEVLIGLSRMNRIRALHRADASMIAEGGVILAAAQRAADENDLQLPISLASEGSCTIGGILSSNAGGVNVLRYGMAREQVLGLEVVLADGRVLDMLHTLRKDNTGYDLKQLFVGAEGTLGIITAAALKLFAQTRDTLHGASGHIRRTVCDRPARPHPSGDGWHGQCVRNIAARRAAACACAYSRDARPVPRAFALVRPLRSIGHARAATGVRDRVRTSLDRRIGERCRDRQ